MFLKKRYSYKNNKKNKKLHSLIISIFFLKIFILDNFNKKFNNNNVQNR